MIQQSFTLFVLEGSATHLWVHDGTHTFEQTIIYHVHIAKNAHFTCLLGFVHADQVNIEIHLYLEGDGAKADVFGIYALSEQQHCTVKTYQKHYAPHTQSQVVLKGMLKSQAQAKIAGLIYIGKDAIKADGSQENKNIVLSVQAHVVSIPSIEVLQHDVQCSHGTAVGQFDQQHLWYLISRGLDVDQAQQLLIRSFFGTIIEKFQDPEKFMEMVCQKMI